MLVENGWATEKTGADSASQWQTRNGLNSPKMGTFEGMLSFWKGEVSVDKWQVIYCNALC